MEIDRVNINDLSEQDFFEKYVLASKPLVITGCVDKWPAFQKWNVDYLKEKIGDNKIEVLYSDTQYFTDYDNPETHTSTFKEIVDEHFEQNGKKKRANYFYILQNSFKKAAAQVEDDIIRPSYFKDCSIAQMNFWCGSGGQKTWGHFDALPNLLCMISGSKTLYLYRPEDVDYFYTRHPLASTTRVDLENPDYRKFPKMRNAIGGPVTVHEGEMFFLPSCWWHAVASSKEEGQKLNIAVNYWFSWDLMSLLKRHPAQYNQYFLRLVHMGYKQQIKALFKKMLPYLCTGTFLSYVAWMVQRSKSDASLGYGIFAKIGSLLSSVFASAFGNKQ